MTKFVLCILAALAGGCAAHVRPATVELTSVPLAIETYPSVVYEGRPVYLYEGRWYFRDGGTWHYYEKEPPALYRQRTYIQQAPPAPRYPQQPAPPAPTYQYQQQTPGTAPPAVRQR